MAERRIFKYVRTTGNDTTGDGTLALPYRTLGRAINSIPLDLGRDRYFIDCTGIGTEVFPARYKLPQFQRGSVRNPDIEVANRVSWPVWQEEALNIFATPTIIHTIAAADVTGVTAVGDAMSVITLSTSLVPSEYKNKFFWDPVNDTMSVIVDNDATSVSVIGYVTLSGQDVFIAEPTAKISMLGEYNSSSISFGGFNIHGCTNVGFYGLEFVFATDVSNSPALYAATNNEMTLGVCGFGVEGNGQLRLTGGTHMDVRAIYANRLRVHGGGLMHNADNVKILDRVDIGYQRTAGSIDNANQWYITNELSLQSLGTYNSSGTNVSIVQLDGGYLSLAGKIVNSLYAQGGSWANVSGGFPLGADMVAQGGSVVMFAMPGITGSTTIDQTSIVYGLPGYPYGKSNTTADALTFSSLAVEADPVSFFDVVNKSFADLTYVSRVGGLYEYDYDATSGYLCVHKTGLPDGVFQIGMNIGGIPTDTSVSSLYMMTWNTVADQYKNTRILEAKPEVVNHYIRINVGDDVDLSGSMTFYAFADNGQATYPPFKFRVTGSIGIQSPRRDVLAIYDTTDTLVSSIAMDGWLWNKGGDVTGFLSYDPTTTYNSNYTYNPDGTIQEITWQDPSTLIIIKRETYTYSNGKVSTVVTKTSNPRNSNVMSQTTATYTYGTDGKINSIAKVRNI